MKIDMLNAEEMKNETKKAIIKTGIEYSNEFYKKFEDIKKNIENSASQGIFHLYLSYEFSNEEEIAIQAIKQIAGLLKSLDYKVNLTESVERRINGNTRLILRIDWD